MNKDGTSRGGKRIGAGRKPKTVIDKIAASKIKLDKSKAEKEKDLEGFDMPPVKDFMTANQKNGIELRAKELYEEEYLRLKEFECEKIVNPHLVSQYAMSAARWIQCENAISEFGFLAKHPTTGAAITSPYVSMAREYHKQATSCLYQIDQIIKDNGLKNPAEKNDLMEQLLNNNF